MPFAKVRLNVINRKLKFLLHLVLTVTLAVGCTKVDELAENRVFESLNIETLTLTPGIKGLSYSAQIVADGGKQPYSFSIKSGGLPPGLSLNQDTGVIDGVVSPSATGSYNFTALVTDADGTQVEQAYQIPISDALIITTTSLVTALVNVSYAQGIAVTGGTPPYTYSASGLPTGFFIGSTTGIISGISSITSSSSVTITVRDNVGLTVSKPFTFNVNQAPDITTTSLGGAGVGIPYTQSINSTSGVTPYTYSLASGNLPTGLTLNTNGTITGTPTAGANVLNSPNAFTVRVQDSLGQSDTQALTIAVSIPPKIVLDTEDVFRVAGQSKNYLDHVKVRGGVRPLTYAATGLPVGLSINTSSGYISGTAGAGTAGTYPVSLTVTDARGFSDVKTKTLTVVSAGMTNTRMQAPINSAFVTSSVGSGAPYPYEVKIADMNNDGINDIVYAGERSLAVIVFIGDGTGNFLPYVHSTGGFTPYGIAIGDIDNDGMKDIISANLDNANLTIFKGDNNWTGAVSTQVIAVGGTVRDIQLGNFNGDALPDIAVSAYGAEYVQILINCGSGGTTVAYNGNGAQACSNTGLAITNYHVAATLASADTYGLDVGDINGDGNTDLASIRYDSRRVDVFLGAGNGTFSLQSSTDCLGRPFDGVLADVTGDGNLDVVAANYNERTFVVMTGDGAGNFSGVSAYSTSSAGFQGSPHFLDAADVDGDGDIDIGMTMAGGHYNNIGVFLNNGTGGFTANRQLSVGYYPRGIAFGNLITGDTRPALAAGAGWWVSWSRLEVLRNTHTSVAYKSGPAYYINLPADPVPAYGKPLVADINKDGYRDIINKIGGASSILFGSSTGAYNLNAATIPTGDIGAYWPASHPHLLDDFNGDGNLDYVSANFNSGGTGTGSVTLGNGDGTFSSLISFTTNTSGCTGTSGSFGVASGDYNGDGNRDLAFAVGCNAGIGSQVYIFRGRGDGSFITASPTIISAVSSYVQDLLSLDVDQDGHDDIITATNNAQLQIFRGNGDLTFNAPSTASTSIGGTVTSLSYGELSGDNVYDYVLSSSNNGNVSIVTGGAAGSISAVTTNGGVARYATAFNLPSSDIADMNRDGDLDILMTKNYSGTQILLGNGSGNFTPTGLSYSSPTPGSNWNIQISVHDLTNDLLPEILTNSSAGNSSGFSIIDNISN